MPAAQRLTGEGVKRPLHLAGWKHLAILVRKKSQQSLYWNTTNQGVNSSAALHCRTKTLWSAVIPYRRFPSSGRMLEADDGDVAVVDT